MCSGRRALKRRSSRNPQAARQGISGQTLWPHYQLTVERRDHWPWACARRSPRLVSEVTDMRVTSKDVVGTVLAAAAVLVAMAVGNGWGWPLLGDYRAGTIALAVIGFGMCAAASDYSTVRGADPFVVTAAALGIAALALIVAGLIWATATLFTWLAVVIVGLWLVTTIRHLTVPLRQSPPRAASL